MPRGAPLARPWPRSNACAELIREGAIDCDASEAGHLKIAHRPGRAPQLEAEAELLQREFEYPAQFLPAAEVRDRHIGGTQSHGALRIPDALAVHPLKLALGVLRMARAAGAVVHAASPVTAWENTAQSTGSRRPTARCARRPS